MRELTTIPVDELTDAELEAVSGGQIVPVLFEGIGSGKPNFNAHSPFTPARFNGFNSDNGNGKGAFIGA